MRKSIAVGAVLALLALASARAASIVTDADGTQHPVSFPTSVPFMAVQTLDGKAVPTADAALVPLGYAQANVSTAVTLAAAYGAAIPTGARLVYLQPESCDLRWRDDGAAPTTAIGRRIYQGTDYPYNGALAALRLASITGAACIVNITFYQ